MINNPEKAYGPASCKRCENTLCWNYFDVFEKHVVRIIDNREPEEVQIENVSKCPTRDTEK